MKLNKTISYIKKDVPLLVDLPNNLFVRFTFFMYFGRSIKKNSKIEVFFCRISKFINFTKLNITNIK